MKWFKHDTDASDDIKVRRLEEEYGNDGYAVFFKILEIIGKEGEKCRLNLEKYPKKWVSSRCHISEEKLSDILVFMGKITLICPKSLKKNSLYIPKFKKRADEYTKRLRRKYGQGADNVPLEENRIDKNRIDKIIKEFVKLQEWEESIKNNPTLLTDVYKRHGKHAKNLLLLANNDEVALKAMGTMATDYKPKKLTWTLETVIKHYPNLIKQREPKRQYV